MKTWRENKKEEVQRIESLGGFEGLVFLTKQNSPNFGIQKLYWRRVLEGLGELIFEILHPS